VSQDVNLLKNGNLVLVTQYFGIIVLVLWTFTMPQFLSVLNNII